jgi:hypothetical protein
MRWLVVPFTLFTVLYVLLGVAVFFLLRRQFDATTPPVTGNA